MKRFHVTILDEDLSELMNWNTDNHCEILKREAGCYTHFEVFDRVRDKFMSDYSTNYKWI